MKQFMLLLLVWATAVQTGYSQGVKDENLKPFPVTVKGMTRYVIDLPERNAEDNYQVELMAGKVMKVDCNNHRLIGQFTVKDVKGWGYTYYQYTSTGRTASTLMGCPDKTLTDKFIYNTRLVRYNSKLPIVVYVPKGYQVKYKIWERQEKEEEAVIK
ncbi:serine protease inhibitor ecotin [Chitinophaga sp. Mgbs1]|uniref:Serine protease inhibitor ecotin n=1 Tax=Chitinophaga solisilvae TaxID=1233460 RepID=A0A433WKS1_9BACT|nr:serine protease inhibitor ecotin [Chitinophaga solisilvae]